MITYSLPDRTEHGPGYSYEHHYEVIRVLDPDAGPCKTCDKPMVRLEVKQHVNHNDHRYTMGFDFVYAHADGSPHHGSATNCVKPKCPQCGRYGTLTYAQEAYGDRTTCPCGYTAWHSIGD